MKKIELDKNKLLTYERIAHMRSKESRLFRDGNVLYKVLRPEFREGRENIITHLQKENISSLPTIHDLLIDPYSKEFLGYTMEFLTDYKTLEDSASEDNHDFIERKKACEDMIKGIYKLIVRGYEHYDIHDRNVMVKGTSARIIDIDSMGNSLYGNVRKPDNKHYDPSLMMLTDITFVALSYLLNQGRFHEQYDYYKKYNELLREFKDDKIMSAYLTHKLNNLITHGFTPEIILDSIGEGQVMKLNHIMKGV